MELGGEDMRYRILLTGSNQIIINEFFTYMDETFECITSSVRYDDIMNHIKYLQPDAFVYCLNREEPDELKRFANIESKITERKIPLVIIGDAEDCSQFVKAAPLLSPLVIQKPITSQGIVDRIVKMLGNKKPVKAEEPAPATEKESKYRSVNELLSQLQEAEEEEKKEERKKHILVVDDDARILRLLKDYLSKRYELATAINGKVALKFLESKETDLILLDYEMPEEKGAAVLEKIRANPKTKDLPVVFLTGVTDKKKIVEVLALKPQGYLVKPIDMEKLSSTIKGILG